MEERIIQLVATRAATLLIGWLGLSPLAKSDNGDRSETGALAAMLGSMVASKAPRPPATAALQMQQYLAQKLQARCAQYGDCYLSLGTDYGPDHELSELAKACEIASAWPIKSHLTITVSTRGAMIRDCRGYRAEGVAHHLVDCCGWLVSPCNIDARLLPTVVAAVERGEMDPSTARLEPLGFVAC